MSSWPASLPQTHFLGTSVGDDESRIRSSMDAGPALVRNRFTAHTQSVNVPIVITGAQLAVFNTFYRTTLNNGADSFTWTHPIDGSSVSYRFINPPKWECIVPDSVADNRLWRSVLDLEILP